MTFASCVRKRLRRLMKIEGMTLEQGDGRSGVSGMALTTELDSRRAQQAISRWVDKKTGDADAWLLNMGYAISGMTRWLNVRKIGPSCRGVSVGPKTNRFCSLQIKWSRANRGLRRKVRQKSLSREAPYLVVLDG